jgi:hypothetical protein
MRWSILERERSMKSLALAVVAGTLLAECAYACCGTTAPHTHTAPSPSVPTPFSVPGVGAVDSAVRDAREAADVKAKIRAKNPDATDEQVEAGTKKVIGERRRREREAEDAGKTHITRSEAREKYRKAIEKNKDAAREKGISDDDLKKRIKAAILKKYAIDDDPAPPETVASASDDPPAPPPDRVKRLTPAELAALGARLDAEKKSRQAALDAAARKQAAEDAYNRSRAYDNAVATWIERRSQRLPDGSWGLASEYNARKVKEYAKETGGVNLEQIWEDQDRAKFTGETLPRRQTEPPVKAVYEPQSPYYKENDARPQPPANYVPRR